MNWLRSWRADPRALPLADRHYNRQKVGSPQFVPPGRCLVLLTEDADAVWVTSWPFARYVKHRWAGAWVCSIFRNEGPVLSSTLIREAVAATRAHYGDPPALGMVTFVNADKVRHKRDPGRCFLRAGFEQRGHHRGRGPRGPATPARRDALPAPLPLRPDAPVQGGRVTLDYEAFHQRLLVFRISLHPGSRIIPGEEGTVVEVPIWFARRDGDTATAETPIEAVHKLVQMLDQGAVRTRAYVRTTQSQGVW